MAGKKKKEKKAAKKQKKQQKRAQAKPQVKKEPSAEVSKGTVTFTAAVPGRVEEVIGRTGTRGEAIQVRCKVLEGNDQNKVLRRNVKGPVRIGDILMLRETEIEARKLNQRRK